MRTVAMLVICCAFGAATANAQQKNLGLSVAASAGGFNYRWGRDHLYPMLGAHVQVDVVRVVFVRAGLSHAWTRQRLTCVNEPSFPTNCAPDEADRLLFARLLAGLSAPIGRLHPYVAVGRERMRMLDRGTQLMIGFHDGVADTTRIDAVKYIPVWTAGLNARVRPNVSAFLEYSRHRDDYLRQYTGDSWDIAIGVGRKLS